MKKGLKEGDSMNFFSTKIINLVRFQKVETYILEQIMGRESENICGVNIQVLFLWTI